MTMLILLFSDMLLLLVEIVPFHLSPGVFHLSPVSQRSGSSGMGGGVFAGRAGVHGISRVALMPAKSGVLRSAWRL